MGLLVLAGHSEAHAVTDDFDDNTRDNSIWETRILGAGPAVAEVNGRLEILVPSWSSDEPTLSVFLAGYESSCAFIGDFDVRVEFTLLTWPPGNGVRVGVGASGIGVVTRVSLGTPSDFPGYPREVVSVDVRDNQTQIVFLPFGGHSGVLRLVRTGATWTGFVQDDSGWVEIGSFTGIGDPVRLGIFAWSHDHAFTDQEVCIAFDNFDVAQGAACWTPVEVRSASWGALKAGAR